MASRAEGDSSGQYGEPAGLLHRIAPWPRQSAIGVAGFVSDSQGGPQTVGGDVLSHRVGRTGVVEWKSRSASPGETDEHAQHQGGYDAAGAAMFIGVKGRGNLSRAQYVELRM